MTPQSQPDWGAAFARAFKSGPFILLIVVFAVASVGMMSSTRLLEVSFRKEPVPLRQELELIPHKIGHWVQVTEDEPLDPDIEHALGTKRYVFRRYVDSRMVGPLELEAILSKTGHDRLRKIMEVESLKPKAFIHFALTYYTGMVDTVAHVPDRCYIADGYAPTEYEERSWKISEDEDVRVRFISFEDATGFNSRVSKNVAYFFQVNGEMRADPLAVRFSLQNLFKADVYYAKIELMMTNTRRKEEVARVMTDFLQQAMPEIRRCLPAREQEERTPATSQPVVEVAAEGL